MRENSIIVGLDIGTTKISTVIGEVDERGTVDIIGEGSVPSEGMKRGAVVNLERATHAIRQSVAAAERLEDQVKRAVDAGVADLEYVVSAADSHSRANAGRSTAEAVADKLMADGVAPDMPVAVLEKGTCPGARAMKTLLADLGAMVTREKVGSPAIIVVGEVVDLSDATDKLARYARVAEAMA